MNRREFKDNLKTLDKTIRNCFLYIEKIIDEKTQSILRSIPPPPQINLSTLEPKFDSLQKQINSIKRVKSDFGSLKTHLEKEHNEIMIEHKKGIEQINKHIVKYEAASGLHLITIELTEKQSRASKRLKKDFDVTDKELFLLGLGEIKQGKKPRPLQGSANDE